VPEEKRGRRRPSPRLPPDGLLNSREMGVARRNRACFLARTATCARRSVSSTPWGGANLLWIKEIESILATSAPRYGTVDRGALRVRARFEANITTANAEQDVAGTQTSLEGEHSGRQ